MMDGEIWAHGLGVFDKLLPPVLETTGPEKIIMYLYIYP